MTLVVALDSKTGRTYEGDHQVRRGTITFDNSYATGGELIDKTYFSGLHTLEELDVMPTAGLVFEWDKANGKVKAFCAATDSSATFAYSPGGGDIKGATADAGTAATADAASAPVNSALYVTAAATSGIANAGALTVAVQPAVPRNVMFTFGNASGGSLNLFEGDTVFTIVGTDARGNTGVSDTVTFTSTAGNKSVANSKFRFKESTKAFAAITSITLTSGTPNNAITIAVGPGTKLGLPRASDTGADADVLSFSLNAAPRTVAGNFDWTNYTMNVGTIADGDDVAVVYKVDSDPASGTAYGTGTGMAEVPSAANLAAVAPRFVAKGK